MACSFAPAIGYSATITRAKRYVFVSITMPAGLARLVFLSPISTRRDFRQWIQRVFSGHMVFGFFCLIEVPGRKWLEAVFVRGFWQAYFGLEEYFNSSESDSENAFGGSLLFAIPSLYAASVVVLRAIGMTNVANCVE
jgi:hypothetical protein